MSALCQKRTLVEITRTLTSALANAYDLNTETRFSPLNQAQQVAPGPAIGFIHLQSEHVIAESPCTKPKEWLQVADRGDRRFRCTPH